MPGMRRLLLALALCFAACAGEEFTQEASGAGAGGATGGASGSAGAPSGGVGASGASGGIGGKPSGGAGGVAGAAAGGTGGGAPVPLQGLVLWLDAEVGVGLVGSNVDVWKDQSGAGHDAAQSTAAARPVLKPKAINGRPAVEFDGSDDELRLPTGFDSFNQGLSFFAVVDSYESGSCPPVLQLSNGIEIDDISFQRQDAAQWQYEVANEWSIGSTNLFPIQKDVLVGVVHEPSGSVTLWGGMAGSMSEVGPNMARPKTVPRSQNSIGGGLYVGCSRHKGLIGEILLYNRSVTDAERPQIFAYLTTKWAV